MKATLRSALEPLLADADIRIDGDRPWDPIGGNRSGDSTDAWMERYIFAHSLQLWQIVFSRDGIPGGWRAEDAR